MRSSVRSVVNSDYASEEARKLRARALLFVIRCYEKKRRVQHRPENREGA